MWALAYAAQNRIGFNHETSEETMRAKDIPLYLLLPTRDDYTLLKHRMEVIVMRILKSHLDLLKECVVPEHVHHQFSQESAEKSRIVNIFYTVTEIKTCY